MLSRWVKRLCRMNLLWVVKRMFRDQNATLAMGLAIFQETAQRQGTWKLKGPSATTAASMGIFRGTAKKASTLRRLRRMAAVKVKQPEVKASLRTPIRKLLLEEKVKETRHTKHDSINHCEYNIKERVRENIHC